MDVTGYQERTRLADWAHRVADAFGGRATAETRTSIDQAIAQLGLERFTLVVIGKAKRGKSTLINAMLGRRDDLVAPIDKLPASSALTRFRWSPEESAEVRFQDGRRESTTAARIREFVTEEFNPENRKCVVEVEVGVPFMSLPRDVVLVDTPGAGSLHEHHDALVHSIIPLADAVIFLVTARMPLDQDEVDLLARVKASDIGKVFFAINRIDQTDESDLATAIEHNTAMLAKAGVTIGRMHPISAKRAFEGHLSDSGVPELLREIAAFLANHKAHVLSDRFMSRIRLAAEHVVQGLSIEVAACAKSTEELDQELRQLEESRVRVQQIRALCEREFRHSWKQATDEFERQVRAGEREVSISAARLIDGISLIKIGQFTKQLPTRLSELIDAQLADSARKMEQDMKAACAKLQSTYPAVAIDKLGAIAIRSSSGDLVVVAGAGGLALATAGGGLIAAGSAAATGIAATNAAALAAASGIAGSVSLASVPYLGSLLSILGVSPTLSVGLGATAAPAMLTTPIWVTLSGPIGWSLAGIGALVVPLAWSLSKRRQKREVEEACSKQIAEVFKGLTTERVPALREMGNALVEEFSLKLDRQLQQIESALRAARDRRPDSDQKAALESWMQRIQSTLAEQPRMQASSMS